jgi:ribosomal protein S6
MEEKQSEKNKVLYELYTLIDATKDEAGLEQAREGIVSVLEKHHANIERVSSFVKTPLAYPIRKAQFAYGGSIYFWAQPGTLGNITSELRLHNETAMRTLISKVEHKISKKRVRRPALSTVAAQETAPASATPLSNTPAEPSESAHKQTVPTSADNESDKVTLDDIDKKLDEIMGEL